jgi:rubrerythrin
MGKEKKKPISRKSYIKIKTEKSQDTGVVVQCRYCGASIDGTSVFCPFCGGVIGAEM